jgi:hypothetical protein
MVAERLEFYRYDSLYQQHRHNQGHCWAGYLENKRDYLKSDRAYRVPSSISGEDTAFIYCEACCYEKGWLW